MPRCSNMSCPNWFIDFENEMLLFTRIDKHGNQMFLPAYFCSISCQRRFMEQYEIDIWLLNAPKPAGDHHYG